MVPGGIEILTFRFNIYFSWSGDTLFDCLQAYFLEPLRTRLAILSYVSVLVATIDVIFMGFKVCHLIEEEMGSGLLDQYPDLFTILMGVSQQLPASQ
ncbi:MAG: hypothetical protein IMW93_10680 [Thermoanaerobacteraceae bacterium]|nr:hypothetical protein [Thermoanaerobacteraceae bacterium]